MSNIYVKLLKTNIVPIDSQWLPLPQSVCRTLIFDLFSLCNSKLSPLFTVITQGHHCIIVKFLIVYNLSVVAANEAPMD